MQYQQPYGNSWASTLSRAKRYIYWIIVCVSLVMFSIEMAWQYSEDIFVKSIAEEIVRKAKATDNLSRVIALRNYLHQKITFKGAEHDDRPFLRATAAETIKTGKGYCGEVTRTFIRLADAVGVKAQRINLFGKIDHVVAEAELSEGNRVIVDSQFPPQIKGLEQLDRVILRPEYNDYSTLNLRRLRLNWLVLRLKLKMGSLTYWSENPHALRSGMWLGVAIFLLGLRFIILSGKAFMKRYLAKNGWTQSPNRRILQTTETY